MSRFGAEIVNPDDPRAASPPVECYRTDPDDVPWPVAEGSADIVISMIAAMYLADKLVFPERVHALLKPGGRLTPDPLL